MKTVNLLNIYLCQVLFTCYLTDFSRQRYEITAFVFVLQMRVLSRSQINFPHGPNFFFFFTRIVIVKSDWVEG